MKSVLVVCLIAFASPAFAEEAPLVEQQRKTFGIDAAVVVPVGDYGEVATLGGGALVRLEVPVGTGFVYGRAGVILHALDDRFEGSLTFVPIYAGYRHPLGDNGMYLAGELGITLGFATLDTPLGEMSDSDSELGVMLSAGMRRGKLDLRGGLFMPDADDAMGLMASAGYDFASF
jgi:hypothetical protein